MNHEMSTMLGGPTTNIMNESRHIQNLQENFVTLLDKFTKKRKGFWNKKLSPNLYISAKDAKKFKIIDKIIGE
jgi:ATP-dependent protease ClpP protease subunit